MIIFYSWQSWSPHKTNWNFIQDSIKAAIKRIKSDETLEVEPVLDRDTQGEAGTVAIADTIFEKIDKCQIFICDVTIVTENEAKHPIPNPNVLIELGYAVARLGWENVICVFNEAYGKIESMPFDLRYRRLLKYHLPENTSTKAEEKRKLVDDMYAAIKIIIDKTKTTLSPPSPIAFRQLIQDTAKQIELEESLREQVEHSLDAFTNQEFYEKRKALISEPDTNNEKRWADCFQLYFEVCENALTLYAILSSYGNSLQAHHVEYAVQRWIEMPKSDEKHKQWRYIPVILLIYTCGIGAIYRRNWSYILTSLLTPRTQHPNLSSNPHEPVLSLLGTELYLNYQRNSSKMMLGQQIRPLLRQVFNELIRPDDDFNHTFDLFEMLLGLCYVAIENDEPEKQWMPLHDSLRNNSSWSHITEFWRKRGQENDSWGLINNDVFPTTNDMENALALYQKTSKKWTGNNPNYLSAYQEGLSRAAK